MLEVNQRNGSPGRASIGEVESSGNGIGGPTELSRRSTSSAVLSAPWRNMTIGPTSHDGMCNWNSTLLKIRGSGVSAPLATSR